MKLHHLVLAPFALSILATAATAQHAAEAPEFSPVPVILVPSIPVPPKPAAVVEPELALAQQGKDLAATIAGPQEFYAGLLLAADPTMRHFLVDLPPLLDQGILFAVGKTANWRLEFVVPGLGDLPFPVHGQAIVLQGGTITASEVVTIDPAK